jgi:hypothetical protein
VCSSDLRCFLHRLLPGGLTEESRMKTRASLFGILGILAMLSVAAPASAAPVDGKWTGMIDTPMGAVPVAFTFKADGAALAGSTTGIDGSETPIKGGKVDGDKISFSVDLDFGGMAFTLGYTGVVSADQIKLTADFMGLPFEFVVKKAQ